MPHDSEILVLVNDNAGGENPQDLPSRLTALFAAAGARARVVAITAPERTADLVREAIAAQAAAVVAGGGDGTVNAVAAALVGASTPLGVLALGTLNHFAKDAGIPLDLEAAVRTIAAGHVTSVDVGEVNGRTFLNNSSIGIYPDIVVEREALRAGGHWKWSALAIASARIVRRYRGVRLRLITAEAVESLRTPFVFVGNNEYTVDGVKLGGRTSLSGGKLFAYVAPRLHGRDLPRLFLLALISRAVHARGLTRFSTGKLDVETSRPRRVRVAVDGEVAMMTTPLRYRIRPGALNVLVPAPSP
jgi:diacylglycerol kinase family enzyme